MTKMRESLSNRILTKSKAAKTLADELLELHNEYQKYFSRRGKRNSQNAFQKIKDASVELFHLSYNLTMSLSEEIIDIPSEPSYQKSYFVEQTEPDPFDLEKLDPIEE